MRFTLLLPAVALACLLTACGSDDGGTASSEEFAAEAERLAPQAVLAAEDLEGFEAQEIDVLEEQADLSAECDVFDAGLVFPEAVATAESEPFLGPLDAQTFNHAAIYRTEDQASTGIASTQAVLDRCEDEFNGVVERIARDELDRLGIDLGIFSSLDITIGNYEPEPIGDEVLGYRMNVNVDLVITQQQYNLDVVVFREGRVVSAVMYGAFGAINPDQEGLILDQSSARLIAVDDELPE